MGIKIWWPLLFVGTIIIACILIFPSDLRLADFLGKAGKFEEAIQTYQKILEKHPDRDDIRVTLGRLYILNNEAENAILELEKVSEDLIFDIALLDQLYGIYSQLGNKDKTITILEKITKLSPNDLQYRTKLAEAYEWNNDTQNAIELYEELLTEKPDDINFLNKLIHLNRAKKNYDKTITYLTKLLDLRPNNLESRILLGNVYIAANEKDLAAVEFEKVLRINPDNEPLRVKLAELYLWMQRFDWGIAHYEYLVMHHFLNEQYFNKLIELTKFIDPPKAIEYFKYRLNYLPRDNDLRQRFVDLYLYLGYTDKAIQQIQLLIDNNPDKPKYLLQLARLYRDIREPHLANEIYESIFQKGSKDQEVIAALISNYQFEKQYDKLLTLYKTLLSKDLADHKIQRDYAETLIITQNYEEAIHQYSKLLKVQPENIEFRIQIAKLYALKKDYKKAIKLIKQGFNKYGFEHEEHLVYAAQFFADHNYDQESIACYEKLVILNEDNLHYKRLLAKQYIKTNNFDKATSVYKTIINQYPENLDLQFEFASNYWLINDFDRMHQIVNEISGRYRDQLDIHKKIGKFYFDRGFFNETIEQLQIELESSPKDSTTLRMLGLAYAWNNQPLESKKILRQYHELYQNDFYTHYEMGELLLSEGDKKNALPEFQTSLALLESVPESKESTIVKAKIYAHQNAREEAIKEFEILISRYPDDISIYYEFAESLLDLKDYEQANHWLKQVLQKKPNDYRALRLQSRSYFEQGKYQKATKILKQLESLYPDNLGLKLDLADNELATGDWYTSTKTLKKILQKYPKNLPAQKRLLLLRREQNQAFSTDYIFEKQSGNFFKQIYNFVFSKATSSILNFKFLYGEESYSSKDLIFEDETFQNLGVNLSSRYNSKLQTSFGATVQRHRDAWYLTGKGMVQWNFNPSNSFTISSSLNELWNDPLLASFFLGRSHRLESDINLFLLNRIFLWNRFSYERHAINKNSHYGNVYRSYFQIGYKWRNRPQLLTYYQFYNLIYNYQDQANRNLISIPENESIHFLGATLNHQLASNFYYELGTSLGFNTNQNAIQYYGTVDLEYTLINRIRLRSHFTYGSQNRLSGNEDNKSLSFDLYYFY
ncbi:MAG: tetratricopeptide repeat protein [bacterium]